MIRRILASRRILAVPLLLSALAASASSQDICAKPVYAAPLSPVCTTSGGGLLYVGGTASAPGQGSRVARFDGTTWSLLPGVFNAYPRALALTSAGLVAGGAFTSIDDVPVAGVARFESGSWVPLGAGIPAPGVVEDLVEHLGELYAAGSFSTAGGVPAANVARWDGTAWQPLGTGLDQPAAALASHQGLLFVGGAFTTAGGQPIAHVAAWDGVQFVPAATNGLGQVYDLDTVNGRLYAAADEVYRLGGSWNQVGNLTSTTSVFARELAVYDGQVFAAGPWLTFCLDFGGGQCLAAARYADGIWSTFMFDDQFPSFGALALEGFGGNLYMSGAMYYLISTGFMRYADEVDVNLVQPKFGAWFEPASLTLSGGCMQPGQPATVRFGSSEPLPATVVSETKATVTVPAGHIPEGGFVDVVLQQNGESGFLPNAYDARPSLSAVVYTFLQNRVDLIVASTTGVGSAWFSWSASPLDPGLPLPGIHGFFELQPTQFFAFGSGSLDTNPTFTIPNLSQVPGGTVLYVQAFVAELSEGTYQLSLTNRAPVVFPNFP